MKYFEYKNNSLYCENVAIESITEKYQTPFYLYSKKAFTEQYKSVAEAFAELNPVICYAMKSNSSLAVMKLLKNLGAGFDIVSGGELHRCKKIGADMRKVVYAGVGKRDDEIESAVKAGIRMFNCESINEIRRIDLIAGRMNKQVKIAVRVNPDVDAKTHKHITTGKKESKFGISLTHLGTYLDEIRSLKNVVFSGVHIHIGSQIISPAPYVRAIKRAVKFADNLSEQGFPIEYFNMGGGFGVQYGEGAEVSIKNFAKMIVPLLKKSGYKIMIEPGRYISGNSGALITQVLYIKEGDGKKFIIVDAGMHNLIRPALYEAYHTIRPLKIESKKSIKADIVGPICESSDFFAKDRTLPLVKERDFLAVLNAGAYGMAMSSRYNSHPFAAEVLVDGDTYKTIRKAESYDEMMNKEVY